MYYAYVYGCNKYEPKLLFAGSDLYAIEQKMVDIVYANDPKPDTVSILKGLREQYPGGTISVSVYKPCFNDIIDKPRMAEEMAGMLDIGVTSREIATAINVGDLAGPGKDYSPDANKAGDWYITKKAFVELYASRGVSVKCPCICRLSIFYLTYPIIDFAAMEREIRQFIY